MQQFITTQAKPAVTNAEANADLAVCVELKRALGLLISPEQLLANARQIRARSDAKPVDEFAGYSLNEFLDQPKVG